jgi:hypothetical protein
MALISVEIFLNLKTTVKINSSNFHIINHPKPLIIAIIQFLLNPNLVPDHRLIFHFPPNNNNQPSTSTKGEKMDLSRHESEQTGE